MGSLLVIGDWEVFLFFQSVSFVLLDAWSFCVEFAWFNQYTWLVFTGSDTGWCCWDDPGFKVAAVGRSSNCNGGGLVIKDGGSCMSGLSRWNFGRKLNGVAGQWVVCWGEAEKCKAVGLFGEMCDDVSFLERIFLWWKEWGFKWYNSPSEVTFTESEGLVLTWETEICVGTGVSDHISLSFRFTGDSLFSLDCRNWCGDVDVGLKPWLVAAGVEPSGRLVEVKCWSFSRGSLGLRSPDRKFGCGGGGNIGGCICVATSCWAGWITSSKIWSGLDGGAFNSAVNFLEKAGDVVVLLQLKPGNVQKNG